MAGDPPIIIGICGYAQVGKDTAAQYLKNTYGYQHRAFANALRSLAGAIDPVLSYYDPYTKVEGLTYSQAEALLGYEGAKQHVPAFREFLKRLGSGAREHVCKDVWVKAAVRGLHTQTVFSDVRFTNEAQALRHAAYNLDGRAVIIRIDRPGYGPESEFEREVDGIRFDCLVTNEGPVTALYNRLATVVRLASFGDSTELAAVR